MPTAISCPRCGKTYTVNEYENDKFCRSCGTLLKVGKSSQTTRDRPEGWRGLFPYEPYPPQVSFMDDVTSVTGQGKVLIAEACNGFGKTISSLSCLLPQGKQIVYATRTHEQVRQVLLELEKINETSGESYTAVNLASRTHLCINPDCRGMPANEAQELCQSLRKDGECPFISEIENPPRGLSPVLGRKALVGYGQRRKVCPYYLARCIAKKSNVVVAPYPYIFNPMIRMSTGMDLEGKVLVLDEGHNIDQVGQEIFSDSLSERILSAATEEVKQLRKPAHYINKLGEHLLKNDTGKPRLVSPGTLARELEQALGESISVFIDQHAPLVDAVKAQKAQLGNPPVSYLNGLLGFMDLVESSPKSKYVGLYTRNYYGAPVIEYRCLDPSLAVKPVVDLASGVLIMSGTVGPLDTFAEIIGQRGAEKRAYPSIQKSDRIRMVVETSVTTSYRERTPSMIARIGKVISREMLKEKNGALIFFTQRGFMSKCLDTWARKGVITTSGGRSYLAGKQFFREGRDATQNREVVRRYKRTAVSGGGAVLSCVFRGRNSEGSNFPEEQARSIFLVGIPYANYGDPIVKAQIRYFNQMRRGLGDEWYTMDAFRAANQSLGRGIRGKDDWCHYWLLDRRYAGNLDKVSRWAQGAGAETQRTSTVRR